MQNLSKHLIRVIAFCVGVWLLWSVIQQISWRDLLKLFQDAGMILTFCVVVYPVAGIFHALALRALLSPQERKGVFFKDVYAVRMIGDSVNKMTPFVDIGGEPFKMVLMARRRLTSLSQAVISVWMSRIGFVASEILLVLLGWLALSIAYPGFELNWVIGLGLVISFIFLSLLVSSQMHGVGKIIPRLAKYLNMSREDKVWHEIDQGLKSFYTVKRRECFVSFFWQFLGWVTALLEVYIIFKILGLEISLLKAFIFQAILQVIKTASFLIPGNLGAQETGLSQLAIHLGYSATDGFALSLLKRFRQLVWVVVALMVWKWTKRREV